jgi:hypothetical protein
VSFLDLNGVMFLAQQEYNLSFVVASKVPQEHTGLVTQLNS